MRDSLYYLAFAALKFLDPAPLVLIEELENGLHPSRIGDVMRVLRELSRTTQVVLATHSPLVINELSGDEVSVITRTQKEGTKARIVEGGALSNVQGDATSLRALARRGRSAPDELKDVTLAVTLRPGGRGA